MYPRSGFRSGGTCERTLVLVFRSGGTSECTLVPVFVPGEHPPKPPFWKTTLWSIPQKANYITTPGLELRHCADRQLPLCRQLSLHPSRQWILAAWWSGICRFMATQRSRSHSPRKGKGASDSEKTNTEISPPQQ